MRADRLLTILALLQAHGRLTTREIAGRLEVSERTVHRDMEALTTAGIPVYAERGSSGGWSLSEGYRHRITGMTSGEIRSLLLVHDSSVVKDLGLNEQADAAFDKLLSALPEAVRKDAEYVRNRIHVDGAGWHSAPSRESHLKLVQEAVWAQRKLRIIYRGWDASEDTERTVSPLGLVAKQSIWYVVAAMQDERESEGEEEQLRTFRLSRLAKVVLLEESFFRPENFELAAYWEQSTERFKTTLPRYSAEVRIGAAKWEGFARERYLRILGFAARGEVVEASVEFRTLESARDILLKYGRQAEAVAPEELRSAVYEECLAAAALYER